MYCGQNKNDEKHGIGMQLFKHGIIYIGEFNSSSKNCKGALLKDGQLIIEGTFVNKWIKYKCKNFSFNILKLELLVLRVIFSKES